MKFKTKHNLAIFTLTGVTLFIAMAFSAGIRADGIYQTLPGTNIRDYSKPGLVQQGDAIYQTLPGSNIRDYSAPGYKVQGSVIRQTLPGSNIIDYSKPGYSVNH